MPLAPDVAVENSVSIVDAGASNAEMADAVSPQRILLIGDSEVRYNNWYFSAANVKKPTETVFFDSKPGTTIGAWNSIFVSEMAKYPKIDVILIFLGTNNFNFSFLQPHQNILDEVKRRNIKCVWIGPTDVRWSGIKNLHMTGPLIKAAVSSTCTYFDAEAANIELADGIHPTKRGSIKWLTLIWEVKDKL
jgi:lysophospholipase L1-like esterase